MSRYYGKIGFWTEDYESAPGVYTPQIIERFYYGDIEDETLRWDRDNTVNENLNLSNRVSIMADLYAFDHFGSMRYCELYGQKWEVKNVRVMKPRLVLTLGGVYNEQD